MVEMGTIRKERFTGLPLLLGAGSLPRLSTAIYRDREEKVS
jgi:hypothetical protein